MIKSRMQTDGFSPSEGQKYKSTLDCVRTVWRKEGVSAFTRGLVPTLIRCVITHDSHDSLALYSDCLTFVGHRSRTVRRSSGSSLRCACSPGTVNPHRQTLNLQHVLMLVMNLPCWCSWLFGSLYSILSYLELDTSTRYTSHVE